MHLCSCPALRRPRHGFTLIELLTVIAIIGILASIIIPTVAKVRKTAREQQCAAIVRQWSNAVQLYAAENKGNYILKGVATGGATRNWGEAILPVERSHYGRYFDFRDKVREMRQCPLDTVYTAGTPTYVMGRPMMNGVVAPETAVPLSRASNPSKLVVFMDSINNSGDSTTGVVRNLADFEQRVKPLFGAPHQDRHPNRVFAAFGDNHLERVHWGASATDPDPTAIWSNAVQWTTLY